MISFRTEIALIVDLLVRTDRLGYGQWLASTDVQGNHDAVVAAMTELLQRGHALGSVARGDVNNAQRGALLSSLTWQGKSLLTTLDPHVPARLDNGATLPRPQE